MFKAIPEPRGCGERKEGGVYAECGVGPGGSPLEQFLLDPPVPLSAGMDLVNKPQLWGRTDPTSGELVLDPITKEPIYDVLIWIGAEYYPEAPDYIEETRRLGASRRLNPQMDLTKLTCRSRMLLAHPRAMMVNWRDLEPPERCRKHENYHSKQETLYKREQRLGPCIFKLWDVLPEEEALETFERPGDHPLCIRRIGSTTYDYSPTGEKVTAWEPGFILGLPISNIALIQYSDGSVNKKAKEKLLKGGAIHQANALPFYETDK